MTLGEKISINTRLGLLEVAESGMKKGQKIRLKASPRAARDWGVSVGAEGTVLCRYRTLARLNERDFLDVKFAAGTIVWGAPAVAFEEIVDIQGA